MQKISLKTKWVKTDGWRGYSEPINAAAGANDTGTWSDSPCPSGIATKELGTVKKALRKEGIKFRETACRSSNVFCIHRYIVVPAENVERAKEITKELLPGTRLLYVA